jgi:hypothetical protein
MPKLIVVMAFDRDADGALQPAFPPKEAPTETVAVFRAKQLWHTHDGVIAWSREIDPALGEYGKLVELYRAGAVPELE